jgi:quinol monooxygenase YgiN
MHVVIRVITSEADRRDELESMLREFYKTADCSVLVGRDVYRRDRIVITEMWSSVEKLQSSRTSTSFQTINALIIASEVTLEGEGDETDKLTGVYN